MATHAIYLPRPKDRRSSPYFLWRKINCNAADNYKFYARSNARATGLEDVNSWKIHALKIGLNCTADVADRYIYLVKKRLIEPNIEDQIEELESAAITADQYKFLTLDQMFEFTGNCKPAGDQHATLQPDAWIFTGDDYLYLYFQGEVAGDVAHIRIDFKFMNWDLGMIDAMDPPLKVALEPVQLQNHIFGVLR